MKIILIFELHPTLNSHSTTGVYILHKIYIFPLLQKNFPPGFFPARKEINLYRTLNFIHIIPPLAYSFSFFTPRRGEKWKKNGFSSLNFYIFSPRPHIFCFLPSFSRVNFAEYINLYLYVNIFFVLQIYL